MQSKADQVSGTDEESIETPRLMRFSYRSEYAHPGDQEVLRAIGHSTWRNNQRFKITGQLTFENHSFVQVMEGTAEAVAILSAAILSDPRHGRVVVDAYHEVDARSFADWRLIGFDEVMSLTEDQAEVQNDISPAEKNILPLRRQSKNG